MTEEIQILCASNQYNDFKGEAAIDEHVKIDTPIYEVPDGHTLIGWKIIKSNYNSNIKIKIMAVEESNYNPNNPNNIIPSDAKIYLHELHLTTDELINFLGRIEIVLLRRNFHNSFGEEYTFVHQD